MHVTTYVHICITHAMCVQDCANDLLRATSFCLSASTPAILDTPAKLLNTCTVCVHCVCY